MSRGERQQPTSRSRLAGLDFRQGAIFGAGAWAVGYILIGVLTLLEAQGRTDLSAQPGAREQLSQVSEEFPGLFDLVGWLFYNAHFVDVGIEILGQGVWFNFVTGDLTVSGAIIREALDVTQISTLDAALDGAIQTVPLPVWLLVPVLSLGAGGFMVASRTGARTTREGAKAGASVVVGYLVLAVVGTVLFVWPISPPDQPLALNFGPHLLYAAGLMGIVYPAVCGALGGAIAVRTGEEPDRSNEDPDRGGLDRGRRPDRDPVQHHPGPSEGNPRGEEPGDAERPVQGGRRRRPGEPSQQPRVSESDGRRSRDQDDRGDRGDGAENT